MKDAQANFDAAIALILSTPKRTPAYYAALESFLIASRALREARGNK